MSRLMQPVEGYGIRDYHAQVPHKETIGCGVDPECVPYKVPAPQATGATLLPRSDMLHEANRLITGDRNNQYGPPTQDFARTAALLNALGYCREDADHTVHPILPSDVALIIARVVGLTITRWRN